MEASIQKNDRPVSLTILCILSMFGNALGLLFFITIALAAGFVDTIIDSYELDEFLNQGAEKLVPQMVSMALSLSGAILMLNLKKTGFYIYLAGQLVWIVFHHDMSNIIFAGLFIILYAIHLKHLE